MYLCNIVVCDNKYMTPEIILISFFWVNKLIIKVTYSEKKSALFIENMANMIKIHFTYPYISQFEKHWGKISPIQQSHFNCHYSDLVDKKLRIKLIYSQDWLKCRYKFFFNRISFYKWYVASIQFQFLYFLLILALNLFILGEK